jgi:hypothetical protein
MLKTQPMMRALRGIVCLLILLNLAACEDKKSMEPMALTQCFEEKETPMCSGPNKVQKYCERLTSDFYLDPARGCYGQRWSIPRAYYSDLPNSTRGQTLVLRFSIPDLTPGAWLPADQRYYSMRQINLRPLYSGKFERRAEEIKDAYRTSAGLAKTEHVMYGMDVYDEMRVPKNEDRDIFFFPPRNAQLLVRCLIDPGPIMDSLKSTDPCEVGSHVDERIEITYHIRYSDMPNLTSINDKVVGLIRSFMINPPHPPAAQEIAQ